MSASPAVPPHQRTLKQRIVTSALWLLLEGGVKALPILLPLGMSALVSGLLLIKGGNVSPSFSPLIDWLLTGQGTGFSFNNVLSRLLTPELFGLMSLTGVVIGGINLFSEIGLRYSLIQNQRDDAAFINTAWVVQIGRGLFLWLICFALAYPMAEFYDEPRLRQLIPVVGLSLLISGFNATKIFQAQRQLTIGRLVLLNLIAPLLGTLVTVGLALLFPSIWVLVAGKLVESLLTLVLSHFFLEGRRNRWQWDWAAFGQLWHYGRWVWLISNLVVLEAALPQLLLGEQWGLALAGEFSLAIAFTQVVTTLISVVRQWLLFPAYSELIRDRSADLSSFFRNSRIAIIAVVALFSLPLSLFGDSLTQVLYDERYAQVGWMVQILAIVVLIRAMSESYDDVFYAQAKPRILAGFLFPQLLLVLSGLLIGFEVGRAMGSLLGMLLAYLFVYGVKAVYLKRQALWHPQVDIPTLIGIAALVGFVVLKTTVVH